MPALVRWSLWFLGACLVCGVSIVLASNALVLTTVIPSSEDAPPQQKPWAIVLGAGVHGKRLSNTLKARMDAAIFLWKDKKAQRLLLSGDGTEPYYNEPEAMRLYAEAQGVPSDALVEDPKGWSTYDSLLRAKSAYQIRDAWLVSQHLHLYRALWLCQNALENCEGYPADAPSNSPPALTRVREWMARTKDVTYWYLGVPEAENRR